MILDMELFGKSPKYIEFKQDFSVNNYLYYHTSSLTYNSSFTINTRLNTFICNATYIAKFSGPFFANCKNLRYIKITSDIDTTNTEQSRNGFFYGLNNCYCYIKNFNGSIDIRTNDSYSAIFNVNNNCVFIIDNYYNPFYVRYYASGTIFESNNISRNNIIKIGTAYNGIGAYSYNMEVSNSLNTQIEIDEVIGDIGTYAFHKDYFNGLKGIKISKVTNGSIGNYAFTGSNLVGSLVMEGSSTETLGQYCFEGTNLIDINMLNANITSIGDFAFQNCEKLTDITMSTRTTTMGSYLFKNCPQLKTLIMGNLVNTITSTTFRYSSIETLVCSSYITTLPEYCFAYTRIKNISLPTNLSTIEQYAFAYMDNIEELTLPSLITTLPNYCFYNSSFKEIKNLDNIVSIGSYCFAQCTNLISLDLPKLEVINSYAFQYLYQLESITIHNTLVSYTTTSFTYSCPIIFEEGITQNIDLNMTYTSFTQESILPTLYSLATLSIPLTISITPTANNGSTNASNSFWYVISKLYVKESASGLQYCESTDEGAVTLATYMSNKNWTVS